MPSSAAIGVNLRVTGHSSQGGRKYMEDYFSVAYQQSEDEQNLEYAFFGIFDGHGGSEAAHYAKEHLMRLIVQQKLFWSSSDDDVLRAIREGYIACHNAMWREQEKWPRTPTGLPSTAGTTATVAFIRHGKLYIGHAGDSGIVLGYHQEGDANWKADALTEDHKPESNAERTRIMNSGGKVVAKSGVSRVVWTRPKLGHKGPIRRSTPIDEIPFLAVARSLGDLWSYNSERDEFVVSPDPDVRVITIDPSFRCLVFGTDGLWNVLSAAAAVDIVRNAEHINEQRNYYPGSGKGQQQQLLNPSRCLVDRALEKWSTTRIRADNTTVVTVLLDPAGPKSKRETCTSKLQQMANDYDLNRQGRQQQHFMEDVQGLHMDEAAHASPLHDTSSSYFNQTHQFVAAADQVPSSSSSRHHQHQNHHNLLSQYPSSYPLNYSDSSSFAGGYYHHHQQPTTVASDYHAVASTHHHHNYSQRQQQQQPQQNLPTFSNLIDDTYSLTKLETRVEQLSSSTMYSNYQQLVETPGLLNYCPQVDLNTINTFHDYAGVNYCDSRYNDDYSATSHTSSSEHYHQPLEDSGEAAGTSSYMPSEAWHSDSEQSWSVSIASSHSAAPTAGDDDANDDATTSAAAAALESTDDDSPEKVEAAVVIVTKSTGSDESIQINEITSSGCAPTPPPIIAICQPAAQPSQDEGPISQTATGTNNAALPTVDNVVAPANKSIRLTLRRAKEKENTSAQATLVHITTRRQLRSLHENLLLAKVTRSAAATVRSLQTKRQSSQPSSSSGNVAATRSNSSSSSSSMSIRMRSGMCLPAKGRASEKLHQPQQNTMLINSSAFNRREKRSKHAPADTVSVVVAATAAAVTRASGGDSGRSSGRRLSKRVTPTKSTTVQTRNRVQRRINQ